MIFFDKYELFGNWELSQKVKEMEADRDYYKAQIEQVKKDKEDLQLNIEKYARENYYMKKDNEDVFIFEEKED